MNRLVLNPGKTYQTFENFGVSGAWWAQVIGGWTEIDEESRSFFLIKKRE